MIAFGGHSVTGGVEEDGLTAENAEGAEKR